MKLILIILLLVFATAVYAQEISVERQIDEALHALPEALRAEAAVIGYDESGERTMLQKGSN